MNATSYLRDILPRVVGYRLARAGLIAPPRPMTLTFSVTNRCQSRCLTCQIWRLYRDQPQRVAEELRLDEIAAIFRSLGYTFFFNISGGEPYLRDDLPEIVGLALRYLQPRVVHIPTNGLAPERIEAATRRILEQIANLPRPIPLTVKPSLDGIGEEQDRIRGVPGNFARTLETLDCLKHLRATYPNLHVEVGTVVSTANMDRLDEIAAFVHGLGVESYRNEIAEQRAEFFNRGDPITPSAEQYRALMARFAARIRAETGSKRSLAQLTESLRLVYYDVAVRILAEGRQVLPCYAGLSNVHINPYGQVWACCVLGYERPMGELREAGLDFGRVWHSAQAGEVRRFIHAGGCACPLANQAYSNILCDPPSTLRAVSHVLRFRLRRRIAPAAQPEDRSDTNAHRGRRDHEV